ncbi:MAG: hypothetical protein LBI43_01170, partial [Streptococcaceae bacterium]|nr:hypothetical protein [Streptococcaceae bacterium]
ENCLFTCRRLRKLRFLICYLDALRQASSAPRLNVRFAALTLLCWLSEHGQRGTKRGDRGNLYTKLQTKISLPKADFFLIFWYNQFVNNFTKGEL